MRQLKLELQKRASHAPQQQQQQQTVQGSEPAVAPGVTQQLASDAAQQEFEEQRRFAVSGVCVCACVLCVSPRLPPQRSATCSQRTYPSPNQTMMHITIMYA